MRKLYFLLPGTSRTYHCGGLFAELKTVQLVQQVGKAEIVTYRQREKDTLFLDDLLQPGQFQNGIFVVSWGFDVPKLVARLKSHPVIYHAHSAGYGFRLPPSMPIITVSRNTMGYWGQQSPNSLIYYLPNQISDEFCDRHIPRDIDVLVQTRKTSDYVQHQLLPTLQQQCRVSVIDSFVEDLAGLFNRSKIYLYDSAEYWAQQGVSEGFGLPPMEAMACGCQVFSSVNSALADYLDPGFNCHKIACYSVDYDLQRILSAIQKPAFPALSEALLADYRTERILQRLAVILEQVNEFFDHQERYPASIPSLTPWRLTQLKTRQFLRKLGQKLRR
jgi:hypothetical protein